MGGYYIVVQFYYLKSRPPAALLTWLFSKFVPWTGMGLGFSLSSAVVINLVKTPCSPPDTIYFYIFSKFFKRRDLKFGHSLRWTAMSAAA